MKKAFTKLNKRIVLQRYKESDDGLGNRIKEWYDEAEVWASVALIKALKNHNKYIDYLSVTHCIMIRYNPLLTAGMRIRYLNHIFYIENIINVNEENKFHAIYAKETI